METSGGRRTPPSRPCAPANAGAVTSARFDYRARGQRSQDGAAGCLPGPGGGTIVALRPIMVQRLVVLTLLSALTAAPAYADARGDARKQVEFGISVAQRGLWREAIFRWQRATEIDPTYAQAFNNLAIAHEQEGAARQGPRGLREGPEARAEQRTHQTELTNLFKEINDRTGRTDGR